jgi:hypothetical protein
VFRYFNHESHAESFLAGAVRFGSLDRYVRIEDDRRRDETEGQGLVREWRDDRQAALVSGREAGRTIASPGHVERHSEVGNPVFILCFTRPPLEHSKFGPFAVEILDSKRLVDDIHSSLDATCKWQKNATITIWEVDYDKGEATQTTKRDPLRLAVAQKPPWFIDERETRIVLISHNIVVRVNCTLILNQEPNNGDAKL